MNNSAESAGNVELDTAEQPNSKRTHNVNKSAWRKADFEIVSPGYEKFKIEKFGQIYSGKNHNIVKVAQEIDGLTGVKMSANRDKNENYTPLRLAFKEKVKVLFGAFQDEAYGQFVYNEQQQIDDTYHMFPTERAGEKGVGIYHDRVKTRIGHWTSKDAINWKRKSTIYQSSGTYALTEDDNPMNDRRGAIWSFMPIFNEEADRWYGYYLAYTVHKEIEPNHSFGRIWRAESVKKGIEGIGGPYEDKGIIIEPGLNFQRWEGRQGRSIFFPYKADNQWLGFYSGAYPYVSWEDYPKGLGKGWFIGLAEADSLECPWRRLDTTINPITSIHPSFIENPIVNQLPNGLYIAIFDGGPEGWGHHLPNMMGYSLSKDGYWSEARYWPIETKVKKWWDIMRTPICLIPEGDGIYTIVYAAIDNERRFHPMGMVKMSLNEEVLHARTQQLD